MYTGAYAHQKNVEDELSSNTYASPALGQLFHQLTSTTRPYSRSKIHNQSEGFQLGVPSPETKHCSTRACPAFQAVKSCISLKEICCMKHKNR
jgi:hypothetical protein